MRKLLAFIGAMVGGWGGWYLGAPVSIFTAFVVSMVGTGLGMYLGIRIARDYF